MTEAIESLVEFLGSLLAEDWMVLVRCSMGGFNVFVGVERFLKKIDVGALCYCYDAPPLPQYHHLSQEELMRFWSNLRDFLKALKTQANEEVNNEEKKPRAKHGQSLQKAKVKKLE